MLSFPFLRISKYFDFLIKALRNLISRPNNYLIRGHGMNNLKENLIKRWYHLKGMTIPYIAPFSPQPDNYEFKGRIV